MLLQSFPIHHSNHALIPLKYPLEALSMQGNKQRLKQKSTENVYEPEYYDTKSSYHWWRLWGLAIEYADWCVSVASNNIDSMAYAGLGDYNN
jgi:hypothetical protein